ncbi:MAG: class I SAM-dependent methyltransferase [Bdellovibrionales bacterium]
MSESVRENLAYKTQDHSFRSRDEYANAKYDITTDWIKPALLGPGNLIVANIGCGTGEYNLRLKEFGVQVLACEPEDQAFKIASGLADGRQVQVANMGLEEFANAHQSVGFDILVMHDVLEHIENEARAVKCVADLIKPGGQAVISVPAYQWLFGHHDVQLGHYRRYTKSRLTEIFLPRFTILHSRYYGSAFIPVTLMFSKWMKKSYPAEAATSAAWKRKLFRTACQVQRHLAEPIGTSALIHIQKR